MGQNFNQAPISPEPLVISVPCCKPSFKRRGPWLVFSVYLAVQGLSCGNFWLQHAGSSSLTRDWTQPPALGVPSLSHWISREVPSWLLKWQLPGRFPETLACPRIHVVHPAMHFDLCSHLTLASSQGRYGKDTHPAPHQEDLARAGRPHGAPTGRRRCPPALIPDRKPG